MHRAGAREGRYAPFPRRSCREALAARAARTRPQRSCTAHQAEAWEAAQRGAGTSLIATPTASGKTLCYTLPVLAAATASFDFGAAHDRSW
jgi:DEAD/DEAH box helicase domain-containing protein